MANKPMPKKKKMKSFKEMLQERKRQIDDAAGFGTAPKPKKKKMPNKAAGDNAFINRRKQENLG